MLIEIGNKLRLAVCARFSDPCLNIQLALPNLSPVVRCQQPLLPASSRSQWVTLLLSLSLRKREKERQRRGSILKEHPKHHETMMTGWLFHPLQLQLTDVSINPPWMTLEGGTHSLVVPSPSYRGWSWPYKLVTIAPPLFLDSPPTTAGFFNERSRRFSAIIVLVREVRIWSEK